MEICTMDNSSSSHNFHQGIDSNQMYNNNNYETIGGNEAYANYNSVINQLPSSSNTAISSQQQQQQNPLQEVRNQRSPSSLQYQSESDNNEQPWKVETIECKEEIDHNTILLDNDVVGGGSYNVNNVEFENYGKNSSGYYDYRSRSDSNNSFDIPRVNYNNRESSNNIANYNNNPYQMSSVTKSQLPTWYHPPAPSHHYHSYDPQQQQQHPSYYSHNFYPHPQQHPYQANYMAPAASTSSTEHNMRNMIHMTANRYIF